MALKKEMKGKKKEVKLGERLNLLPRCDGQECNRVNTEMQT